MQHGLLASALKAKRDNERKERSQSACHEQASRWSTGSRACTNLSNGNVAAVQDVDHRLRAQQKDRLDGEGRPRPVDELVRDAQHPCVAERNEDRADKLEDRHRVQDKVVEALDHLLYDGVAITNDALLQVAPPPPRKVVAEADEEGDQKRREDHDDPQPVVDRVLLLEMVCQVVCEVDDTFDLDEACVVQRDARNECLNLRWPEVAHASSPAHENDELAMHDEDAAASYPPPEAALVNKVEYAQPRTHAALCDGVHEEDI